MDDESYDDSWLSDYINKKYMEPYYANQASYKLMNEDNELCADFGRTVLKTIDGKVVVTPEAPECIEINGVFHYLSDLGKERWNKGLSISYFCCFIGILANKNILKAEFR